MKYSIQKIIQILNIGQNGIRKTQSDFYGFLFDLSVKNHLQYQG